MKRGVDLVLRLFIVFVFFLFFLSFLHALLLPFRSLSHSESISFSDFSLTGSIFIETVGLFLGIVLIFFLTFYLFFEYRIYSFHRSLALLSENLDLILVREHRFSYPEVHGSVDGNSILIFYDRKNNESIINFSLDNYVHSFSLRRNSNGSFLFSGNKSLKKIVLSDSVKKELSSLHGLFYSSGSLISYKEIGLFSSNLDDVVKALILLKKKVSSKSLKKKK